MSHYASLSFFSFKGRKNKWWAFKQMQLAKDDLQRAEGSHFIKLMGCGSHGGFSIWPDFGSYALLATWDCPQSHQNFMLKSNIATEFNVRSAEQFHILMQPYQSHGTWSGVVPFQLAETPPKVASEMVAVITRATINPKKLVPFWRLVPKIGKSLTGRSGLFFAMGMGEWPLFELTTFSVWEDAMAMQNFAYSSPQHLKAIKHTRQHKLFKEDLFARFMVLSMEGSWKGSPMSMLAAPYPLTS